MFLRRCIYGRFCQDQKMPVFSLRSLQEVKEAGCKLREQVLSKKAGGANILIAGTDGVWHEITVLFL